MVEIVEGPKGSFFADALMGLYLRGKITTEGHIDVAGETDDDIGTVMKEVFNIGDPTTIKFRNAEGEHKGIAAGAIAVGARIYGAANGKFNDVQATGSYLRGIALSTAAADGDIFKFMPLDGETAGT